MKSILFSILLFGFVIGCGGSTTSSNPTGGSSPTAQKDVTVTQVNYDQLDNEISKHKGKIVVIDLWGTWCKPCMEKFPKFLKMAQSYTEKPVLFMSLCLPIEDAEKSKPKALNFLTKQHATIPNYLLTDYETWNDELNIDGAPAVRIYDVEGKLHKQFSPGEPTPDWDFEDVEKVIEQLLSK